MAKGAREAVGTLAKKVQRRRLYRLGFALALGQLVSLFITATGLTSSILAIRGVNAPTAQSFCNYLLLSAVYGTLFVLKKRKLQVPWYYYLFLAFIDVEANYVVVKAYQYTSLTSVMLLDCWSIPCVLVLTWFFLKTRYKFGQFLGVCICVVGLVLVILSDVHSSDRSAGSKPVLGDILVIIGSMLYAFANVSEEYLIKKVNLIELLTFLGLFGALISACQVLILEREELASIHWTPSAVFPFIGYAVALFLFYSSVPFVLKMSGSALLNLSLLTSDMWAVAIRVFAYHEMVDWLYFIAFATVAVGLVIYAACGRDNRNLTVEGRESTVEKQACEGNNQSNVEIREQDPSLTPTSLEEGGVALAFPIKEIESPHLGGGGGDNMIYSRQEGNVEVASKIEHNVNANVQGPNSLSDSKERTINVNMP